MQTPNKTIHIEKLSLSERVLIIKIVHIVDSDEVMERLRLAATLAEQFLNKGKN